MKYLRRWKLCWIAFLWSLFKSIAPFLSWNDSNFLGANSVDLFLSLRLNELDEGKQLLFRKFIRETSSYNGKKGDWDIHGTIFQTYVLGRHSLGDFQAFEHPNVTIYNFIASKSWESRSITLLHQSLGRYEWVYIPSNQHSCRLLSQQSQLTFL